MATHLRRINLNLLVVFDALMAEKSVAGAARKIGLTPSAVSHALQRLRDTFNDPLLERTTDGMKPTQRAEDLIKPVREALHLLQQGLADQLGFDAATAQRTFTIRISDFMTQCLVPRLCTRVRLDAPNVTLIVAPLPSRAEDADPGDVQVRIRARVPIGRFRRERLLGDVFVVAMGRHNPAAGEPMSFERFLELPYLEVSSALVDARAMDALLAHKGIERRPTVTVPSLASVRPLLEFTDLCTILPRLWVSLYAPNALATCPLPFEPVDFSVDLVWSRQDDTDGGQAWLRRLIGEEFAMLQAAADAATDIAARPDRLDVLPTLEFPASH
jgi:DNA-binding transcriptional LysR family regulator